MPSVSPNIVAIIFAHNEEHNIASAIFNLSSAGKVNHIIVINDGSTDRTAQIAKKSGAIVISHKTNLGKREGFISGVVRAKKLGAEVILTLDADITHFPKETFDEMISEVTVKNKLMAVATQYEKRMFDDYQNGKIIDPHSNAQRAISMKALDPLLKGDSKWVDALTAKKRKWNNKKFPSQAIEEGYRWALEFALDNLIPQNKVSHSVGEIITREPYRTGNKSIFAQKYGREIVRDQLQYRSGIARSLFETARRNPLVWRELRKKWLAKKRLKEATNRLKIAR